MKRGTKDHNLARFILGLFILAFMLGLSFTVFAEDCVILLGGSIEKSMTLCEDTYIINEGLNFKDNVILDCNNAVIAGNGGGVGAMLNAQKSIEIRNCHFKDFHEGILVMDSKNITIDDNIITDNTNGIRVTSSRKIYVTRNIIENNTGTGLHLVSCVDCDHSSNQFQNNMNSILLDTTCYSGDNICPDYCNVNNDYDCPYVCGDNVCTNLGDCDCKPGQQTLFELNEEKFADLYEQPVAASEETDESIVGEEVSADEASSGSADAESSSANAPAEEDSNAQYEALNFEVEGEPQAAEEPLVVYPIVKEVSTIVPPEVISIFGTDQESQDALLKLVDVRMVNRIYQDKSFIDVTFIPKRDIKYLMFYEYFPMEILNGSSAIDVSVESSPIKKKQAVKVELRDMEEGKEQMVTFTIDKELTNNNTSTVLYKAYYGVDFVLVLLCLLMFLPLVYYLLEVKPFMNRYSMYMHSHMAEKYSVVSKDKFIAIVYALPVVALIFLFFGLGIKIAISQFLVRLLLLVLALIGGVLAAGMYLDIQEFRERYNIKIKKH